MIETTAKPPDAQRAGGTCDYDCGFCGTFEEVEAHEQSCSVEVVQAASQVEISSACKEAPSTPRGAAAAISDSDDTAPEADPHDTAPFAGYRPTKAMKWSGLAPQMIGVPTIMGMEEVMEWREWGSLPRTPPPPLRLSRSIKY